MNHIEDLPINEFIEHLRDFSKHTVSEKIDGSNIHFGIDEEGFYTSREEFGGKRIRNVDDYEIKYATTYMRSCHLVLEKVLNDLIEAGLSEGDRIEAEVLFSKLPNVVPYDSCVNRIVFLRKVEGTADLNKLKDILHNQIVKVSVETPYTVNGKDIQIKTVDYAWKFEQVQSYSGELFSKTRAMKEIGDILDQMEKYLESHSGIFDFTNADIISIHLNRKHPSVSGDWKALKEEIKKKRSEINNRLSNNEYGYKFKIKNILLNNLVRNTKSQFGPSIENGGWIEGAVVRNNESGEQFKIVDKFVFKTVKDFLYEVRTELSNSAASLNSVNSFVGGLKVGLGDIMGHPLLGTNQAKRYLRKHGTTKDEVLAKLSNFNYPSAKAEWIRFLDLKEEELEQLLKSYNKEKVDKKISISVGDKKQTFTYCEEVDKRTIQVFSELFNLIRYFRTSALSASSSKDLIMALISNKIDNM